MSYESAIAAFCEIILNESDDDHQGDSFLVVKTNWPEKFGYVTFGWGSCSGCDAWEAADTPIERAELILDILRGAYWFDSLAEVKAYVASKTEGEEWYEHRSAWKIFRQRVAELNENAY